MSKTIYIANDNDWDIIMTNLGMDMESKFIDREIRNKLSDAYDNLKEVNSNVLEDIIEITDSYLPMEASNYLGYDEDDTPEHHMYLTLKRIREWVENIKNG